MVVESEHKHGDDRAVNHDSPHRSLVPHQKYHVSPEDFVELAEEACVSILCEVLEVGVDGLVPTGSFIDTFLHHWP